MRILWVATKAPTPITDGGRAVMLATIEALAATSDARLTVVTPLPIENGSRADEGSAIVRSVQENPRFLQQSSYFLEWPNSIVRSFRSGRPVSIERHGHAPLAARVAALMRDEPPFDVVHSEQLQALPIAEPARRAGVACVLRAQNVESAVWDKTAGEAPTWRAAAMRIEARRMRRFEAHAIADIVDATIALSADDAAALAAMSPLASSRIITVPPPIPAEWLAPIGGLDRLDRLDHLDRPEERDGRAAFIWIGSAGWAPNDGARDWLLGDIWPAITARLPDARLNVFGSPASARAGTRGAHGDGEGDGDARGSIVWRGAPRQSAEAFMPGSIMLIPMRSAAGVRMRVLEAWARGVPVIASPAAIAGLDAEDGRDVLIAADGRAFAEAAVRLAGEPSLRARLVHEGRATLARRHDPKRIAEATLDVYRQAIERRRARQKDRR
jgi:glycosyltransferase involved in cell wall biosynthesis